LLQYSSPTAGLPSTSGASIGLNHASGSPSTNAGWWLQK
jgi:hypothetical protein